MAIKVLRQSSLQCESAAILADFQREAEMLQSLRHPSIVPFYGACFSAQPVRQLRVDWLP